MSTDPTPTTSTRRRRRIATASALVLTLAGVGVLTLPAAAQAATSGATSTAAESSVVTGKAYPGSPNKEAKLVAAENERIYNVRALASAARWSGLVTTKPYRLATGSSYTLVLVARGSAYTVNDLKQLAPSTFVKQPDGSYLLSENIVVENGATLQLASPDGLHIHMESDDRGFVSIVTQAGALQIAGSAKAPVIIDSWDPQAGKVDTDTTDGRAYVRVQGGTATLSYASFRDLGFWSGTTGGVSLTGTDLSTLDTASGTQTAKTLRTTKDVFGTTLLPTGAVDGTTPGESTAAGSYSFVSAKIQHTEFDGNAYGLFLTSADGVVMSDSTIENSLIDGLVLHRYVTNSTLSSVDSHDNGVDGIKMTRASTGIVLSQVTANRNGRNGITLNGGALADGPNAVGMPTGDYGNNSLTDSTASDNGRYGVEVLGGENVKVSGSTMDGNRMGIVVGQDAVKTTVRNNVIKGSTQNGISVLDGVRSSEVSDNTIAGADIGIYSRASDADVDGNEISGARTHGVTVVGASKGTTVTDNSVSGRGPSAIDLARSDDAVQHGNTTTGWHSTKPLLVTLRGIFQPLTVLWLILLLIVVVAAIGGVIRGRRGEAREHPYAKLAPLSSFTRGVVDPTTLGLPASPISSPMAEAAADRVGTDRVGTDQGTDRVGTDRVGTDHDGSRHAAHAARSDATDVDAALAAAAR